MAKKFLIPKETTDAKTAPQFSFEKVAVVSKSKQKTKYGSQQTMLTTKRHEAEKKIEVETVVKPEEELIEQIDPLKVPEKVEVVSEEEKQKLEEANVKVVKNKGKKKKIINIIFLLVNIAIVAVILFGQASQEEGVIPFKVLLEEYINFGNILFLLVVWLAVMVIEALKYEILIYDSTKRHRFGIAYKLAAIGRYYDDITPLGGGGQPFQVFYLKSRGLSASDSLSVPIGKYVFNQITFILFAIVVAIASMSTGSTTGNVAQNVVSVASWIGIALNAALIFSVAFVSVSKTISQKMINGILKLLQKIKIIKNYEKQAEKINKVVAEFQSAFKTYAKKKSTIFMEFLLSLVGILLHYSIPFFIYCVFYEYNPIIWAQIIMICVMVDMAASFIPVPGGSGVAELSFTALMGALFSGGTLFWALIFWRVLTFYIYIIQGPVIMAWDYLFGNNRQAWQLRKWQLEEESKSAAVREQISIFDKIK